MIQGIITRLADKSFVLKGASLTLTSAFLVLAFREDNTEQIKFAILPVVGLWALDALFLHRERLFRRLYDVVRQKRDTSVDFSMDLEEVGRDAPGWLGAMFSRTLLIFHLSVLAVVVATFVWSASPPSPPAP